MGCRYVPGKERSIDEIVHMVKLQGKRLSEVLQKIQEEKQYTGRASREAGDYPDFPKWQDHLFTRTFYVEKRTK